MSDVYAEPTASAAFETNIKRSRFIANVLLCRNEASVRENLKEICAAHRNANHNCWAYILAEPYTEHSSDAGEPSGTAGRPILGEILRASLVNALVVVTRYFGGVKLGVRGLIEAYSEAAREVLKLCPRAERVRTKKIIVTLPYNSIGDVTHVLTKAGGEIAGDWHFSENIDITVVFRQSNEDNVLGHLQELSERDIIRCVKEVEGWEQKR